jgi:hypothetical protein
MESTEDPLQGPEDASYAYETTVVTALPSVDMRSNEEPPAVALDTQLSDQTTLAPFTTSDFGEARPVASWTGVPPHLPTFQTAP